MSAAAEDVARLAEARAYDEAYRDSWSVRDDASFKYLQIALHSIDARDAELADARAEIERLRHGISRVNNRLALRDAELARLRAHPAADAMRPYAHTIARGIAYEETGDADWSELETSYGGGGYRVDRERLAARIATAIEAERTALTAAAQTARREALEEAVNALPRNYQFSCYPTLQATAQMAAARLRDAIRALAAAPQPASQDEMEREAKSFDGNLEAQLDHFEKAADWPHGYRHADPERAP